MGKAARKSKEKKNLLYKKAVKEEKETPTSRKLLNGLDSTNVQTRISTSGAIAAMFGDAQSDMCFTEDMSGEYKEHLEMVRKSQLLKTIVSRAADADQIVCMNILGALRNMCIVGGDEFIKELYGMNIIVPLKSLLYKLLPSINTTKENELLIVFNGYLQLFSLLSLLFDYDASGFYEIESNDTTTIHSVLLALLSYSTNGSKKLQNLIVSVKAIVAEFITAFGEHLDENKEFMQQLHMLMEHMDWTLKMKLVGIFVGRMSISEKMALYQECCCIIAANAIDGLLQGLCNCYEQFALLQKSIEEKKMEEKELMMNEADVNEAIALDKGQTDEEAAIMLETNEATSAIYNYMNVMEVVSLLLSAEEEQSALSLPPDQATELYQKLSILVTLLLKYISINKYIQTVVEKVLVSVLDVLSILIQSLPLSNDLLAYWSSLTTLLSMSSEVCLYTVKNMWIWVNIFSNSPLCVDQNNPVCYPQQIMGVVSLLERDSKEVVVQVVNMLSFLLSKTKPVQEDYECIKTVCQAVVHVLEVNNNATNGEIVANVLDFVMTVFGNDSYVPLFRELNLSNFVYSAANALQSDMKTSKDVYDDDCFDYMEDILNNTMRFIDWMQGGMK